MFMGHIAIFQVRHDSVPGQASRLHEMSRNLIVVPGPKHFCLHWFESTHRCVDMSNHFWSHQIISLHCSPNEHNTSNHESDFCAMPHLGVLRFQHNAKKALQPKDAMDCTIIYREQNAARKLKFNRSKMNKWVVPGNKPQQSVCITSFLKPPKRIFVMLIRRSEQCAANI